LGGGFPVAACLATERAAACMTAGSHGSTFGGNPLAMAVANAVLDVMLADGFLENVERMGALLRGRLDDLAGKYPALIEEVRGVGLMIGLKLGPKLDAVAAIGSLRDNGLLTVPAAENVIRLLPPLIVEESHVDEAMAVLDDVFSAAP
ncbi:MAG: aminotransferase class III-fold pyridoxal phosphate-dependent enzyme, partial [Proteobacteria bacterium]|nr:aminotransferase class III-fold pyridoxal phosphate-dependent enzyme [Pseudomonadota bacterium]